MGRGNRAFEIYWKTCPSCVEEFSEIHRTEPYVYSQMVAGPEAPNFGEGKNSWLTGTAAWTFTCISQYILGIKPEFDGIRIDPCIPSDLKHFSCTRKFRGSTCRIEVNNPDGVQHGVASVTVNGTPCEDTLIRIPDTPSVLDIQIAMR
jgi:cellobiose phosphorylase